MANKEVTVLFIDDDELDYEATKRAFKKAKIANPLLWAQNGEVGLDYLRGENGRTGCNRPCVVLLDLNMPRMDGLEFLQHVRDDPKLAGTVVFVLTTSDADRDRWAAYDKQVAGYILKYNVGKDFVDLISMLESYWKIVEFPEERK